MSDEKLTKLPNGEWILLSDVRSIRPRDANSIAGIGPAVVINDKHVCPVGSFEAAQRQADELAGLCNELRKD